MTSLAETIHHHFSPSHGSTSASTSASGSGPSSQPISFRHHNRHSSGHRRDEDEDRGAAASGEDEEDEEYSNVAAEEGAQEMMNEQTVKAGYLWKKGEKRKTWKKRWFVLRSSKLCYYKNEKEYQLLRYIDMSEVHSVAAIQLKRQDNTFGIVTPKRAYYVKASTSAETQDWIRALNDVKTQLSQRNTMTSDFADLQMSSLSGAGDTSGDPPTSPVSTTSTARPIASPTRERSYASAQAAAAANAASAAAAVASGRSQQQPISINVPGKGNYASPARPRPIPNTQDALSPLTATTDSETGAEHYGLSYTSSMTGHSFGSSPGRDTSPGSELSDTGHATGAAGGSRAPRSGPQPSRSSGQVGPPSRRQDTGSGSSAAGGGMDVPGGGSSSYQNTAVVLSSSEEEDEVDEHEQLDRAMPLPTMPASQATAGAGAPQQSSTSTHIATPSAQAGSSKAQAPSTSSFTPAVSDGGLLLREPNRVIVQGYLMKQSNRRKTWRKRWFVLTASRLMYTRSHMDNRPHRHIPLESILDAIEHTSKKGPTYAAASGNPNTQQQQQQQQGGSATGTQSLGEGGSELSGSHGDSGSGSGHKAGGSTASPSSKQGVSNVSEVTSSPQGSTLATSPPAKPERRQSVVAAAAAAAAGVTSGLSLGGSGGSQHSGNTAGSGISGASNGGGNSNPPTAGTLAAGKRMDNCFKIITPKRVYLLCAPTEEEEIKWLSALQALLTRSRGQQQQQRQQQQQQGSTGNAELSAANNSTSGTNLAGSPPVGGGGFAGGSSAVSTSITQGDVPGAGLAASTTSPRLSSFS